MVIGVTHEDGTILLDVEVEMLNLVVDLESTILKTELADVCGCLGVLGCKGLDNDHVLLLVGELLLVDSSHVGLIHESHVIFIFKIFSIFFGDGVSILGGLAGSFSASGSSSLLSLHYRYV